MEGTGAAVGGVALAAGAVYLAVNQSKGKPAEDKAAQARQQFNRVVAALEEKVKNDRRDGPGTAYVTEMLRLLTPMASFFTAVDKKYAGLVEVWNEELARQLGMEVYVRGVEGRLKKIKGAEASVEVYERAELLEFALKECAKRVVAKFTELARRAEKAKPSELVQVAYREHQAIHDIHQLLTNMVIGGKKFVRIGGPQGFSGELNKMMQTLSSVEGKAVQLNMMSTWSQELANAIKERREPHLVGDNLSAEMGAIKEALEQYARWAVSLGNKRPFDMPGETKYTLAKEAQTAVEGWMKNYAKMREKVDEIEGEGLNAQVWHYAKKRVYAMALGAAPHVIANYLGLGPGGATIVSGVVGGAYLGVKGVANAEWRSEAANKVKEFMKRMWQKAKFWTSEEIGTPEEVSNMIQNEDSKAVEFLRGCGVAKMILQTVAGGKELSDEEMYYFCVSLYTTVRNAPKDKKLMVCQKWLIGNRHQISNYSAGEFDLRGLGEDWIKLF